MYHITDSIGLSGRRRFSSDRRAFTLVELLVVVAIIALLISILLPSLTRAKGIARMVKCSTNQHAIGRGSTMYASENNDYVPRDAAWGPPPYTGRFEGLEWYLFAARFSNFVGGPEISLIDSKNDTDGPALYDIFKEMPVYQCPSFQNLEYALTYITNGWNFRDPTKDYMPISQSQLTKMNCTLAEVGYIAELNPSVLPARTGRIVFGGYDMLGRMSGSNLINWDLTFHDNGSPNTGRMINFIDQRHFGNTTIVFFDGHAESRKLTPEDLPARLFFPH